MLANEEKTCNRVKILSRVSVIQVLCSVFIQLYTARIPSIRFYLSKIVAITTDYTGLMKRKYLRLLHANVKYDYSLGVSRKICITMAYLDFQLIILGRDADKADFFLVVKVTRDKVRISNCDLFGL